MAVLTRASAEACLSGTTPFQRTRRYPAGARPATQQWLGRLLRLGRRFPGGVGRVDGGDHLVPLPDLSVGRIIERDDVHPTFVPDTGPPRPGPRTTRSPGRRGTPLSGPARTPPGCARRRAR